MPGKRSNKKIPGYSLILMGDYYKARKIGMSAQRIKTDPAFAMTRKYATEFGHAAKMVKMIRNGLSIKGQDNRVTSRLVSCILKLLDTDTTNDLGSRNIFQTNTAGLVGFEFNKVKPFGKACKMPVIIKEQNNTGEIKIEVPPFVPAHCIQPIGATNNYKITFRLAHFNAEDGCTDSMSKSIQGLITDLNPSPSRQFTFETRDNQYGMLILAACMEWYTITSEGMMSANQRATAILYASNGSA
jgi:hypothetical protein